MITSLQIDEELERKCHPNLKQRLIISFSSSSLFSRLPGARPPKGYPGPSGFYYEEFFLRRYLSVVVSQSTFMTDPEKYENIFPLHLLDVRHVFLIWLRATATHPSTTG